MYIRVKVIPGAKKESFEQIKENEFRVAVKEKAERNMANGRVVDLLAHYFNKKVREIRLVSGHHSRTKMFSVSD